MQHATHSKANARGVHVTDGVIDGRVRLVLMPTSLTEAAAFVAAHLKCPNEIDECIRLVTTKAGLVDGTAAHALVLKCSDLQRAKIKCDRVGLMKDMLSLLYKHVKNQRGVAVLKNNDRAYTFFLGGNFRPTKF